MDQKVPLLRTFRLNFTIANFHQIYEKVLKTTQNVPKTIGNHQVQLVLGLGYQF